MPPLDALSEDRLRAILGRCADLSLGVIGDLALDAYWYADMTRAQLSRETPHFPRPVVREQFSAGAGANVANNLAALGVGTVRVFSVLGDDWRGSILSGVLASAGIDTAQLIVAQQRSTSAYIKPIVMGFDSQQEDARLDFENDVPLAPDLENALIDILQRALPHLDGLLIADQLVVNGIVTTRVRQALNDLAVQYAGTPFVVDSRERIGLFRSMVLKPNKMEALHAVAPQRDPQSVQRDDLIRAGDTLRAQSGHPTFITLGEEGVLVCAEGAHRFMPAAPVRPPLDLVGAGDAFIAALAAALAVGATPWEAGTLATLVAAVVVEKLDQTGTASPDEIFARYNLARSKGML